MRRIDKNMLRFLDENIIIYGAGKYGMAIYNSLINFGKKPYITDRDDSKCTGLNYIPINKLYLYTDYCVVIAIKDKEIVKEVYSTISKMGYKYDNIYRYIDNNLKYIEMREKILKVDKNEYSFTRIGAGYGGYYLCVDLLKTNPKVLSLGIGEDVSFDLEMIEKYGCKVYAFDPTPKSINYIDNHDICKNESFMFYPYGVSMSDGLEVFHLPQNDEYVSGSVIQYDGVRKDGIIVKMISLNTIILTIKENSIDVMKLDIEGSEFDVILSVGFKCKPMQICLEVHDRFFDDGLEKLKIMNDYLHKQNYFLAYVSDDGLDLTYILSR